MEELKKFLNPIFFVIIIICFFLPFFNITCQQQKITSVTGFELVSGTTISTNGLNKGLTSTSIPELNNTKNESVSPEPLALIALLLAVTGLVISFYQRFSDIGSGAIGLLGAISLIFLNSVIADDLLGKVHNQPLAVECAFGYYIALIFFIILLLYNAYAFYMRIMYNPVKYKSIDSKMRFCPKCGSVNDIASIYCNVCGTRME
jgi:hypothetical protein